MSEEGSAADVNTFVLLGLVVLLVLFLLRSRRRGRDSGAGDRPATRGGIAFGRRRPDDPGLAPAAAAPFDPAPFGSPFAAAPHAGAPVVDPAPGPAVAATRPASPPDPSDWAPADMIVEPGWPLPGEIAGTWSSGPETAAAPVATVETPLAETAATLSPAEPVVEADEWEMPALDPVPAGDAADEPDQATGEVPVWTPEPDGAPAAEDVPMWMPEPGAAPAPDDAPAWIPDPGPATGPAAEADLAWAADAPPEPDRAADADADLPAWTPDSAPAGDIWPAAGPAEEADAPVAGPPAWEPPAADAAPVEAPAPDPAAAVAPAPPLAPEPAPDAVATADVPPIAPEPAADPAPPVWDPAPALADLPVLEPPPPPVAPDPVAAAPVSVPPAAPQGATDDEIAALLAPALAAVRPLVRVSDHAGVTPRMLVVMRALAERPLSVGEQASLLGVSRPVVADVATRLEGLGLTRRERDERDRRRVRMALTDRGRRVCAEAAETPSAESVAAALAGMAGDERAALLRGLRALATAGPA